MNATHAKATGRLEIRPDVIVIVVTTQASDPANAVALSAV
jgi:hypothetical protein